MRKEKIIAWVLGLVMVCGLIGVGFIVWNASKPKTATKQTTVKKTSTSTASGGSLSVGDNSGIGAGLSGGSDVLGKAESVDAGAQKQKQEDFSQYDKYKDAKSALVGEISKGTGAEVKNGSAVGIYYIGRLTSGAVFDNQWPAKAGDKPKPFEFAIGTDKIIAGLQQGMVGMKVGGKRRIIVPPAVGYGDKGQGSIPPTSVLIFDVELLSSK